MRCWHPSSIWTAVFLKKSLPQLALIGSLAGSLCRQFIEFFLSFSSPPSSSSFSPFLLSLSSCVFLLPFLLCLASRWPGRKKSSCSSGEECINTSDCALCQGLQRDLRHSRLLGQNADTTHSVCLLSSSPKLLCLRCVRVYSGVVCFIHGASPFITGQGIWLCLQNGWAHREF